MSYEKIDESYEFIRNHLPKYLTPKLSDNLFKLVKENFPNTDNDLIYSDELDSSIYYQGDAIIDIPFSDFNIKDFNILYFQGVIISNTCDIASENDRMVKPNIQLAKIISLGDLISQFKEDGHKDSKIEEFVSNLKGNRISNLFFLPQKETEGEVVMEDSFIRFDSNVTLPIELFENEVYDKNYQPTGDRVFSFSNYGFYTFLVKLSVHYCRFREGVFRTA
jgi:hypothetical protein